MRLFVIIGTVIDSSDGKTLCVVDAYVTSTIDEALQNMVELLAESYPLAQGFKDHAAQGYQIEQHLIDAVATKQSKGN